MSYSLALAPTMAAWQGPQRLVLRVDGEQIADVEYHPTPTRVVSLARVVRTSPDEALQQIAQACPTCGFAHALAFCQAMEQLLDLKPPVRARFVRTALAEIERASSHLTTLIAIFDLLGLTPTVAALREPADLAREALNSSTTSLAIGGLRRNLSDETAATMRQSLVRATRRLFQIVDRTIDQRATLARTVDTGILSRTAAEQFGLHGPLARASGLTMDLRVDAPYAAYADLKPQVISQEGGDVYARIIVLLLESLESLKLAEQALQELPANLWHQMAPAELPTGVGEGQVEAPRGALKYQVETDGRWISAIVLSIAPQFDRLLARTLLSRAAVDDAVLIALSTDPCTTCLAMTSDE